MSRRIRLLVTGDMACFTRPELKAERVSYDVMTPSAARGVLECIHWKPAISWIVDAIHVLNPVVFETMQTNEITDTLSPASVRRAVKSGDARSLKMDIGKKRAQRMTRYLKNVAYVIEAHFELTAKAVGSDNENKHLDIFERRASQGRCFEQPCLGLRQFAADFRLVESDGDMPAAIPQTGSLGYMLWGIDYDREPRTPAFFKAEMIHGVVKVPSPGSKEIVR